MMRYATGSILPSCQQQSQQQQQQQHIVSQEQAQAHTDTHRHTHTHTQTHRHTHARTNAHTHTQSTADAHLHDVLHPERGLALVNETATHVLKQLQRLSHRPLPPRRHLPVLKPLELVRLLVAHVCTAPLDQLHGRCVQLVKVVGRVRDLERRVPEPRHVAVNALEELLVLRIRVCVVIPSQEEGQEAMW